MIKHAIYLFFLGLLSTSAVLGQAGPSSADYERAVDLMWENLNNKRVYHLNLAPNWLPDSSGFWFLHQSRSGKSFQRVSFSRMARGPLFDHDRLAQLLRDQEAIEARADSLPFNTVEMVDTETLKFSVSEQTYQFDLSSYQLTRLEEDESDDDADFESKSPDGKWIAFSKDYNLYVRNATTKDSFALSTAGRKLYEYASWYGWGDIIEGEGDKRPPRFGAGWSPDSRWIHANIADLRSAQKMYLLDWSVDSLYRPQLLGYYRGSPGDTTMVHAIPVLFDLETRREIRPQLPRSTYINNAALSWSKDGRHLYAAYWERGYKKMHLVEVDPHSGKVSALYADSSDTNVDTATFQLEFADGAGKAVLTSERSGWNQLYLLDLKTIALTPITSGAFVVGEILYIDEPGEQVYFSASGREAGRNPYHQHVYKVGFDGSGLTLLTPEDAHHAVTFSPDGAYFVDNYSTVSKPTVSVLRKAGDGAVMLELSRADITGLKDMGWQAPEVFTAQGRDGTTDIYGAIWKPANFDPSRKYPIIDNSYTGPHTFMFPNTFTRGLSRDNQALAELGFIVVMVDGLGSAGRSKAFRNWSYKRMGYNLTDHVLAIRQLGERHTWVDTTRVGIFGHSAGGYDAAHGLLQFPDFYKVGVASSGDHDHRMEKAWWPEMYMGWPVDSTYHQQSNITMAANLKGKLLLTHGGIDENVNPSATFKLSEALIRADKEFDLLIFPSQRHGYTGQHRKYFIKKRWNYFVEHLLGATPIWDFGLKD